MRSVLLLVTALFARSLQAGPGNDVTPPSPCPQEPCFQVASPCPTSECLYGLQGAVDRARTRGPKVDVKATLTDFLKGHPGTAVLLLGQDNGKLALWAYQGLEGTRVTSQFTFASFVEFVKVTKGNDPRLAGLLLPDPILARLKGAPALVILPMEGFPRIPFADLKPAGAEQPLGTGRKVTVLKRLEQLGEI